MRAQALCFTALAGVLMTLPTLSRAGVSDAFHQNYAQAIYEASPEWVHDRRPQPLLRAVVVLKLKLLPDQRWDAEIMRGNDLQPEMVQRALAAAKRVRVERLPEDMRERLMRDGVIETWLFDNDGRFQVRTLARSQQ